jgi:hypothetical protein
MGAHAHRDTDDAHAHRIRRGVWFHSPHPQNPPTKRPPVSLMKQARAFGVGIVIPTQNPMDLDYRALSNAGVWRVGRLQTDADRARVAEALSGHSEGEVDGTVLAGVLNVLAPRWFVLRGCASAAQHRVAAVAHNAVLVAWAHDAGGSPAASEH